jgi:hypothetical protein
VIGQLVDRKWDGQPEVEWRWYNQEEDEVVSYQVVNQVPILMKDESPVQSEAKDFCDPTPDLVQPDLTVIISNHDYSFMFTF